MGAVDTLLPDGIYSIQYQLNGEPTAQTQLIIFISGQVRTTTYSLFLDLIDTIEVEDLLLNHGITYHENVYAYLMENMHSIDIDTPLDFKIAECIMKESCI